MTKFATFKETGFVEVLYDDAMKSVPVPTGAVQITDDEWLQIAMHPDLWKLVNGAVVAYTPPIANEDVNTERERRIAAGATVTVTGAGDIPVQGREEDVRNLQGLGLVALARVSTGDTTTITEFRDAENVYHDLTPPQVLELVQAAAGAAEAIIQASWAIKAMDPIPADYADDTHWPAV
jgi:hypothetical protein